MSLLNCEWNNGSIPFVRMHANVFILGLAKNNLQHIPSCFITPPTNQAYWISAIAEWMSTRVLAKIAEGFCCSISFLYDLHQPVSHWVLTSLFRSYFSSLRGPFRVTQLSLFESKSDIWIYWHFGSGKSHEYHCGALSLVQSVVSTEFGWSQSQLSEGYR